MTRHISKLVMTVRDYARKQVMQNVMEVTKPEILKITAFDDNDIRKLLEVCYGITNRLYTDRIVTIAEGNARLAMLAGKLAIDSGNLSAIQDASDLYRNYYSKQLTTLAESPTMVSSAGIIAFVQAIHLDHLEKLTPVFDILRISSNEFASDLTLLHKAEIVDLCNDKAARISDQSFSNFLIKYVFIEQKIIPLSTMIETCFCFSPTRTIEACNILLNVFLDPSVQEYMQSQIIIVWDKLHSDPDRFLPFFKAFHLVRPTQTLSLILDSINQESQHPFDVRTLSFQGDRVDKNITDDILQILGDFEDHPELPTALDLLLLYYKKRPDLFEQFYSTYTGRFEVNLDSPRFGYFTQCAVVKNLCDAIDESPEDSNLISLFVHVTGHFLKLDISKGVGGRHNTFTYYKIGLSPDNPVLDYRQNLLAKLYQIYQKGNMQAEIEYILYTYGQSRYDLEKAQCILRSEFNRILSFFSLFQPSNLFHCVIAAHIEQIAKSIDYSTLDVLVPFLASKKYKIYSALSKNRREEYKDGYEQGVQRHKDRVNIFVENYALQDIDYLIQVCIDSVQTFDKEERKLASGLEYVFEAFQDKKEQYLFLVERYMKADTPYKIYAGRILEKLFELKPASEVKELITRKKYNQQNIWLWFFYALMPQQQISSCWVTDLLHYLDTPDLEITTSPTRNISLLRKYEIVDSKIVFKALRIISNHYDESPFIFSLYVSWLLNHDNQEEAVETVRIFSDELSLLEKIYLEGISYASHEDYNGFLLYAIICVDTKFLYKYLDYLIQSEQQRSRIGDGYDTKRLQKIWDSEQFMDLADDIFNYCHEKRKTITYWPRQSPLFMMLQSEANNMEITTKQDYWIKCVIEQYNNDSVRMYELFSAIRESSCNRRKLAVEKFLSLNSDLAIFEQLPLESSHWGGSGSLIPYMQERIEYLRSLLPLVSGMKYLKHKQRIELEIERWKERIHSEEVRELLESWYC